MEKVAIIRCEKNMDRCPLSDCLASVFGKDEGFSGYEDPRLIGVFTCHCKGQIIVDLARILKIKGADAIHFCTCTFATETEEGWSAEQGGFCAFLDDLIGRIQREVGIRCLKGTAHLPEGHKVEVLA